MSEVVLAKSDLQVDFLYVWNTIAVANKEIVNSYLGFGSSHFAFIELLSVLQSGEHVRAYLQEHTFLPNPETVEPFLDMFEKTDELMFEISTYMKSVVLELFPLSTSSDLEQGLDQFDDADFVEISEYLVYQSFISLLHEIGILLRSEWSEWNQMLNGKMNKSFI